MGHRNWVVRGIMYLCVLIFLIGMHDTKAFAEGEDVSVCVMEVSTGTVIKEEHADIRRAPASVTKVMTLLLAFERIEQGKMKLDDVVVTSEHAKSMGGSQVFLEEGEEQSVETIIKCIIVASGNDAAVAMAEHIAGSEQEFVNQMNEKANQLGMQNTHFVDCCGLTDSEEHYTSAHDIALMTRELVKNYPQVYSYASIWMEDIVHQTSRGASNFTLSNTNKLLKQYEWATGLKTGFTNRAKYCISATANKNGIDLITVILGAETKEERNRTAIEMFNYGFSVSSLYQDANQEMVKPIMLERGVKEYAEVRIEEPFRYLDTQGRNLNQIEKRLELPEKVMAPVNEGDVAGRVCYSLDGEEIGSVCIVYSENVQKACYKDYLKKVWDRLLL